jgi:DNA ligase-1
VPEESGGFEHRLNKAKLWFGRHLSDYAFVIEHKPVSGEEQLMNELEMIEEAGGEGIILRRSGSPYTHGRSRDVLKLKSFSDMEATVVSHLGGEGRNAGRMGSLLVELPNEKTRFKIGTGFSDEVRENPPPVGSIITFKYYGFYKSGIPKYPTYLHEKFNYQ